MYTFSPLRLFKSLILIFILFNALLTYSYATDGKTADEQAIDKLFQDAGKESVVTIITQKRDGQITIQKNKSFFSTFGKPNIDYVTAKTVLQDLTILDMSITEFKTELDTLKQEEAVSQKQAEDERASQLSAERAEPGPVLSNKLSRELNAKKAEYAKCTSYSERRRLKKEISILNTAYRKAKKNEKSTLRVYTPDSMPRQSSNSRQCDSLEARLQKLTDPSYRHQIFFCNNKNYKDNPKSCKNRRYGQQVTLLEYKKKVSDLELEISKKCR